MLTLLRPFLLLASIAALQPPPKPPRELPAAVALAQPA